MLELNNNNNKVINQDVIAERDCDTDNKIRNENILETCNVKDVVMFVRTE